MPNQTTQKEKIYSKLKKWKWQASKQHKKSKFFGGKKSNTPDEIGLNQVLKENSKRSWLDIY